MFYPEHREHEELNKFSTKTGNTEEKAIRNMSADIIIVLQDHCAGGKEYIHITIHFLQVVLKKLSKKLSKSFTEHPVTFDICLYFQLFSHKMLIFILI